MPYIHFTEEQKNRAASVNLEEFLRMRGEKLTRSGGEKRMASDHSVTIRGSEWYDHATEKGGGPISFVRDFYGLSYPEAVSLLLDGEQGVEYPMAKQKEEAPPKPFELPPVNGDCRRVYAYLLKQRHIDREVVSHFVKAGLLYEDAKYHNCVFVGTDENGAPRHAHKRSTNSQGKSFRMTVEGSDFRYAFNWPGSSNQLMVFEAPIDMLSFISKFHDSAWARHSYVALCGTSSQPMLGMLERYPQIDTVHFALDNDQAGQLAMRRLAALAREKGLTVNALVPVLKDWNEDLCANFQQTMEEQQNEQVLS